MKILEHSNRFVNVIFVDTFDQPVKYKGFVVCEVEDEVYFNQVFCGRWSELRIFFIPLQ